MAFRVISSCQNIGCVKPPLERFCISGQAVIGYRAVKPHKSHIMVQPPEFLKSCIQLFLVFLRRSPVSILFCGMIHLPHHPRPEAIGPPEDIPASHIGIAPVLHIGRNHAANPVTLGSNLYLKLIPGFLRPVTRIAANHTIHLFTPPALTAISDLSSSTVPFVHGLNSA